MESLEAIKKENKIIADFIVSTDGEGRLCLLSYNDFLKKYFSNSKEEKILLLYEFEELLETGKLSPEYLSKEWRKIDFGRFIHSMNKTVRNIIILEERTKLVVEVRGKLSSTLSSNIPIHEKILSLSKLKKNYIQFYGKKHFDDDDVLFDDIESELDLLKEIQTQQLLINDTGTRNNKTDSNNNWHPRIFKEQKHFQLFEHLHKQGTKYELAEYSFIYWSMYKDRFIDNGVKPTEFINWLNENYEVTLLELMQLHRVKGSNRPQKYQTAKLLFKC